ncbi:hypothetical protein PC129_g18093 [Phytophthora cactorum]|nr:hypothetical protein Pcac1_g20398 [Phytophthora cactorum]KAG2882214.1 hypothetical protein PC114_g21151 [Phytophthora cactorum]KAG2904663.1 hypothetical protein PC117_g20970 [Phytophthora cactorum]KAG2966890.1 hypothetical protein PC118_g18893 [Phytophthora cactorum]KAG2983045.1 hypothetical protein PC119_g20669 [Phytophthora cactorum]
MGIKRLLEHRRLLPSSASTDPTSGDASPASSLSLLASAAATSSTGL